ncbi:MAG: uroporphyrinogen-III synthase [Alphaproteobacteria bacterium]|nr:uroporphyrinogen-III synthase [Alphaproteobacteria bacterium]
MGRRYRVLLTRPEAESEALATELAARGIDGVVAPVLEIQPTGSSLDPPADTQALILTSGNALDALTGYGIDRTLPVFTVGDDTASRAQGYGFTRVDSAAGTAEHLIDRVADRLSPADGPVLWASGEDIRVDLRVRLATYGFRVVRRVVYRASPVTALPQAAVDGLHATNIDGVLFFSPRTAECFISLIEKAGLMDRTQRLIAHCLSPAVADAAGAVTWLDIRTARRPNRQDLLATLDGLAPSTAD